MTEKIIHVTKPFLPPLEELLPSLEQIWATRELTNGAFFHREFESELARYLGVPFVSLFTNATIALVTALQCLRITGEVITTPYSFVATAHSLLWNGVEPVFVDIDPKTLAMDATRVEAAISPRTTAIMPVHVYGRPADIDGLQRIAETYGLRIIYDAAHAFGATFKGRALADYGDLSVLSFHATKAFNTFEGGAIVSHDEQTKQRIDFLKNFGFAGETTVVAPGINGKMSEFQAALGMVQLRHFSDCVRRRKEVACRYDAAFMGMPGISVLGALDDYVSNYSYYPVFIDRAYPITRNALYAKLKERNIYARRYFYPLISDFPMYRGRRSAAKTALRSAHDVAESVICLPIYPELAETDQKRVIDCILEAGR